jgi:hypothetical protein
MAYRHDHEHEVALFTAYWVAALLIVLLAVGLVKHFGPWS